jgi:hypothetical protein
MFGYLKLNRHHTPIKIHKAYKNYYCGLCFAMQYSYGQLSRCLISYDVVLIGLLIKSHEQPEQEKLRCFGQKKQKQQFMNDDWKKIASIIILLAAGKLRDNIEDENSLLAKIAYGILKGKIKKAQKENPDIASIVFSGYEQMLSDEKAGKSVVEISEGFSNMMESIYRCVQSVEKINDTEIEYIKAVAGWVYFIDQLDDYKKDIKKGRMNPLVRDKVKNKDYIHNNFYEILGLLQHYYKDILDASSKIQTACVENDILQQILATTIPSMTSEVLAKRSGV